MERHSEKRDAIIQNLRSRYDHPTADMVYEDIRKQYPSISMGTVYRNLSELCDRGIVVKIGAEGKERYDGHPEPHNHFFCEKCGLVYDINMVLGNDMVNKAAYEIGGSISSAEITFRGVCRNCK